MTANVKGSALIEIVKVLRKNRDRVHDALSPELRSYLDKRILMGTWYPENDYLALLRAVVKLAGTSFDKVGAMGARKDLGGVYARLTEMRDVERVVAQIPALWKNYHDTGREVVSVSDGKLRVELIDFVIKDVDYCKLIGGY